MYAQQSTGLDEPSRKAWTESRRRQTAARKARRPRADRAPNGHPHVLRQAGIEMECRQIKGARARTASRPHGSRAFLLFFFIFAAMLCNILVLPSEVRPAVGANRRATLQAAAMILHRIAGDSPPSYARRARAARPCGR